MGAGLTAVLGVAGAGRLCAARFFYNFIGDRDSAIGYGTPFSGGSARKISADTLLQRRQHGSG